MTNFIKNLFRKKYPIGLLPDPPDPRDYLLAEIQPEVVALPDEYDLRGKMGEIGKQNYGSCTAWAGTGVKEYWDRKQYGYPINLSEKFVYHNIKKISGLWDIQGDYLRNSLKALCNYGVPLLKDYPDDRGKNWYEYVQKKPLSEIYVKAEEFKGKTYWSVGKTLENFRQAIYQNQCPVATGMRWWSSYVPSKDGKLPLPLGTKRGGHAISCVGWTKDKLWFRNSWGKSWGKDGYFYIPFNEFNKHEIWNIWIILDLSKPEPQNIGWVASGYLRKDFVKGDIVYPSTALNFRIEPWGKKIKVLKEGELLEILGEKVETGNIKWERVKLQ